MKCEITGRDKLINDYISGAISEKDKKSFDEHCFNCDVCFRELMFRDEAVCLIKNEGKILFAEYLAKQNQSYRFQLSQVIDHIKTLFEKQYVLAYAAVTMIAMIIGTYVLVDNFKNKSAFTINFDNQVPYAYDTSSFRGGPADFKNDPQLYSYVNQFKMGVSDYLICNYEDAISRFENMKSLALSLQEKSGNQKFIPWLRDLYFYNGLSHLALSTTQQLDLEQDVKTQHADVAIQYLEQANLLTQIHTLQGIDREIYFLGLAYGIGKDKNSAVVQLRKIKPETDFYSDAQKLIQEWSNK